MDGTLGIVQLLVRSLLTCTFLSRAQCQEIRPGLRQSGRGIEGEHNPTDA